MPMIDPAWTPAKGYAHAVLLMSLVARCEHCDRYCGGKCPMAQKAVK